MAERYKPIGPGAKAWKSACCEVELLDWDEYFKCVARLILSRSNRLRVIFMKRWDNKQEGEMYNEKRTSWSVLVLVAMALFTCCGVSEAQDQWPREIPTKEGMVTVYQPQLESFKGDQVTGRAALSIKKKEAKEPTFGVVWFSARAMTNRDTRLVEFMDFKIDRVKFPFSQKGEEARLADFLAKDADNWERTPMALDRFLAQVAAVERGKAAADQLNTDPPKIIFTTVPSALIVINGKPELRKVENSDLERVINTPFVILYAPSARTYYLKGGDFWYSAPDVMGQWKTITTPPPSVLAIARSMSEKEDPSEASQDQPKPQAPPQILVVTEPTELIVADGDPKFEPVQGTGLLYMSNTPSEVFLEVKTQQYYVLLAGRWYHSGSLDKGPWTYASAEKLPPDFMKIPPGSAKGHVLAFVAGTTQAQEAVLDAQIPQTAAIKRSEAKLNVTYDGSPKFERIKGTTMDYALNTGTQILKVQGRYYACDQAVWFVSDSPNGPWSVADSIPNEIDTIPPDSPVYNVKYVHVYDSTPEVVYVGYTPGYVGSYVYGDTVVYGTGYVYPAWIGAYYYPWPITWGFAPIYDPFYCSWGFGWGFGAGFISGVGWGIGWGWGPHWGWGGGWHGWWPGWGWGGWHHWGWHDHWNRNISRPINIGRTININRPGGGYRPGGMRPGPRENLYNHGDNVGRNAWTTREGRSGHGLRGMQDRTPGMGFRGSQNQTTRQWDRSNQRQWERGNPRRDNNVFAGRDGSVYRRTERGWQQRTQGGWARPESRPQTRQNFTQSRPGLERDFSVRQRGYERSRDFGRMGGYGGYGGYRGGGLGGGGYRGGGSGARGNSGDARRR